ncbi:MAG: hypothetical protein GY801_29745, partial [bacterium]|nr:hypothetical protein [bacterium]
MMFCLCCLVVLLSLVTVLPLSAAENRPVASASSVHSAPFVAFLAVDGDSRTRWASKAGGKEWIQLDFGKSCAIDELEIVWEAAYAEDYQIQVSDDSKNWRVIYHQKQGKGGTESLKDLKGSGRYLRLARQKTGKWPHMSIWELKFSSPEITALLNKIESPRKALCRQLAEKYKVRNIVFAERAHYGRGKIRDGHWYANISYYSRNPSKKTYTSGGSLRKLDLITGKTTILLKDDKGTIRDPAVHYDGKTILFSYRKGGTAQFHLYEIQSDGSGLKQLTFGIYDDIEPCWLPDDSIMFVSGRARRYVNCYITQVATLYKCDRQGRNIRQISANVEHDNTPCVLADGRVIFQRWEYVDRSQVHYHHLWSVNQDGTGQMVYFGNMHPGGVFIDPQPIPDSHRIVFIHSPLHGSNEHVGQICTVTDRNGPDNLRSMKLLNKAQGMHDPWSLSKTDFLAAQGRRLVHLSESGAMTTLYTHNGLVINEPRPLMPRKRERIIPSRIDLKKTTGTLMLTDVTIGRNMKGVKKGQIKKLLILESLPKPINYTGSNEPLSYGGTFTLERVLGTVPVEMDGSAHFEVPANRALILFALDKDGRTVKRMQSFLSVMPGESTSCVGCHEER